MEVPTYRATAKRVTGVAGQQMGFKVPGGALSQGQVAVASGYQQLGELAAQWGATAYGLHRQEVVSRQVSGGQAQIDTFFLAGQSQDPFATKKQNQPVPFFDGKMKGVLAQATKDVKDPITKREIISRLQTRAADARRKLQTFTNNKMIEGATAGMTAEVEALKRQIAPLIPLEWDGKPESLKASALDLYGTILQRWRTGLSLNLIGSKEFQKLVSRLPSDLSKLTVEKRLLAARTSDETEKVIEDVQNPENYPYLVSEDRQDFLEAADKQALRQMKQESAKDDKDRREAARVLTQDRRTTYDSIYVRIENYKQNPAKHLPVLPNEILTADLEKSQREALMELNEDRTPTESVTAYVAKQHILLDAIEQDEVAYGTETEAELNELQSTWDREVAKGAEADISQSDYIALRKRAASIRKEDGTGAVVKEIEKFIHQVAKKDALFSLMDPLAVLHATTKATEVYLRTGDKIAAMRVGTVALQGDKRDFTQIMLPRHIKVSGMSSDLGDWAGKENKYLIELDAAATALLGDVNKPAPPDVLKKYNETKRDIAFIREALTLYAKQTDEEENGGN